MFWDRNVDVTAGRTTSLSAKVGQFPLPPYNARKLIASLTGLDTVLESDRANNKKEVGCQAARGYEMTRSLAVPGVVLYVNRHLPDAVIEVIVIDASKGGFIDHSGPQYTKLVPKQPLSWGNENHWNTLRSQGNGSAGREGKLVVEDIRLKPHGCNLGNGSPQTTQNYFLDISNCLKLFHGATQVVDMIAGQCASLKPMSL